jgi:hypothetical protein
VPLAADIHNARGSAIAPQCDLTSRQSLSAVVEANVARSIDCVFYEVGPP